MPTRLDERRTRRWNQFASTVAAVLVLASCTSPSPTASPGTTGSITATSPTAGASSPAPEIEADSATKIDAAERAGTIDHDTALVNKLYASLDYGSLPIEYQSSNPAAPEATTILTKLSGRLEALPPELRAKVAPFFLRPTDADSFWQKRSATAAADPAGIELAAFYAVIEYGFVDARKTSARVWYATPRGPTELALAQKLADEIDNSDMWAKEKTAMLGHEPCSDANSPNNGGDGRLDIYLIYPLTGLDWGGRMDTLGTGPSGNPHLGVAVPEPVERPDCPVTSHLILNAALDFDRLKATTAHELFHAFQYSFNNAVQSDRDWWAEASATWAMDLVYPTLNLEHGYLKGNWSKNFGFAEGPLDSTAGTAAYGAYIWPFYLVQKSRDPTGTVVGRLWQASETRSSIAAMAALPDWADDFKEFALWNWNRDGAVKYIDAGAQIPATALTQDTECIAASGNSGECTLPVGTAAWAINQNPTTVQYFEGIPDVPQVQMIRFDLAQVRDRPGLGIQAILSIGDGADTKIEDWTGLSERKFCLNSEDVRKIVLVTSNSQISGTAAIQGAVKIEAAAAGCGGFTGEITYKANCGPAWQYPNGCVTEQKATGVRFELIGTQGAVSYYQPVAGTVTDHLENSSAGQAPNYCTLIYDGTSSIPGDIYAQPNPSALGSNLGLRIDATDPEAPLYSASSVVRMQRSISGCGSSTLVVEINQSWIELSDPEGGEGLPVTFEGKTWVLAGSIPSPYGGGPGLTWRFTGSP